MREPETARAPAPSAAPAASVRAAVQPVPVVPEPVVGLGTGDLPMATPPSNAPESGNAPVAPGHSAAAKHSPVHVHRPADGFVDAPAQARPAAHAPETDVSHTHSGRAIRSDL